MSDFQQANSQEADSYVGRMLSNRYLLVFAFASGPLSWMFRALDVSLRRDVAIKLLRPNVLDDVDFMARFKHHAQLAAQLNHTHIADIYDWDIDGSPYLVTELCRGGSLRSMLDNELEDTSPKGAAGLNITQTISIGIQIAEALGHAHQNEQVHRDLCPANILFDLDGRIKLTDFGIAPMFDKKAPPGITESQSLLGSSYYSAPEQLESTNYGITEKVDVYTLALILLECIMGALPFVDDTSLGTYINRVSESVTVPEELGDMGELLSLALKLNPAERPSTTEIAWHLKGLEAYKPAVSLPIYSPAELLEEVEVDWDQFAEQPEIRKPFLKSLVKPRQKRRKLTRKFTRKLTRASVLVASVAALVVIAAGIFTIGAINKWASNPAIPEVPDLVGGNIAALYKYEDQWEIAQPKELRVRDVPLGEIISLNPPAGTSLKKGEILTATISLGDPLIVLPSNLLGSTLEEAQARLSGLGLKMGDLFLLEGSSQTPLAPLAPLARESANFSTDIVVGFAEPIIELVRGSEVSLLVRQ